MEKFQNFSEDNLKKSEAINEILAIRGNIFQSGSFDSEDNDLSLLIKKLQAGKITSEEALKKARSLEGSRQSYH